MRLPYDSPVPIVGIFLKIMRSFGQRNWLHHGYHIAVHNIQDRESTKISIIKRMEKGNVLCIQQNAIQPGREFLSLTAKWIELDDMMLSKISQTPKDNFHMLFIICGR